jgi:hypothetical protein
LRIKPSQLVAAHIDLLDRMKTRDFRGYMWDMGRGTIGKAHEMPAEIYEGMHTGTMAADLYRVSPDMSMVIQQASSQFDESDRIDRTLCPSGCGLVYFEEPIMMRISSGKKPQPVHWLLWVWLKSGFLVMPFLDLSVNPDEEAMSFMNFVRPELRDMFGRWACRGVDLIRHGERLGGPLVDITPERAMQALRMREGVTLTPSDNPARLLHALWLLLSEPNEKTTQTEVEHLPKTTGRAAARAGVSGRITVVALRRGADSARQPGESTVERNVRWVVTGHWRWQRHGEGLKQRKRIWITAHVKGPEGKPIIHGEKIYDVRG